MFCPEIRRDARTPNRNVGADPCACLAGRRVGPRIAAIFQNRANTQVRPYDYGASTVFLISTACPCGLIIRDATTPDLGSKTQPPVETQLRQVVAVETQTSQIVARILRLCNIGSKRLLSRQHSFFDFNRKALPLRIRPCLDVAPIRGRIRARRDMGHVQYTLTVRFS